MFSIISAVWPHVSDSYQWHMSQNFITVSSNYRSELYKCETLFLCNYNMAYAQALDNFLQKCLIYRRSLEDTKLIKTTFTRCRYDLKTEQNHYGKASCLHDAGMKTIWRRYEMKMELL